MQWRRLGLVYEPVSDHPALLSHAALPVAARLGADFVRVFFSGRDHANRSSIGSVVLRLGETPRVEERCSAPVLTPGIIGAFDDAGLGMGSIIPHPEGDRLYYMGWNVGGSVPWRNAIGLAIGSVETGHFERFSNGPIMDRDPIDHFSLSYPWVVRLGRADWRMWYGTHLAWGAVQSDMSHAIRTARSDDGIAWHREAAIAIGPEAEEVAVVRPTVQIGDHGAEMWYARRGQGGYRLGYAASKDLAVWTRQLGQILEPEASGWENGVVTYPCVFEAMGRRWMLYNGADYGRAGFGLAVEEQ